jgi:C-terminal processing protease CtpA/Prc
MSFNIRRVAIFFLLIVSFAAGVILMRQTQLRQSLYDICDLVDEKFYLNDEELGRWVHSCRQSVQRISIFSSKKEIIQMLQAQMDLLHVSHFLIYTPVEDEKLWKGQATETGLKTRWMEDHLIVYQIVDKSPAMIAGFHLGDEVKSIDGAEISDPDSTSTRGGLYRILRKNKELLIKMIPGPIQVDSRPALQKLDEKTALVTLSSFRAEYFADNSWKEFVRRFSKYSKIIVDLRENAGGNLVAMLRALSPFFCEQTLVGELALPRRQGDDKKRYAMVNDLSDDAQISEVETSSAVALQTFPGYGCFRGAAAVLIGPHTSSVSEIFASAMLHRSKTLVMGQPTSGDVVLAVWYELPSLGAGYSISIPEALYLNREGKPLEGNGVFPQREVFDDLEKWRMGHDSWIEAAKATNIRGG